MKRAQGLKAAAKRRRTETQSDDAPNGTATVMLEAEEDEVSELLALWAMAESKLAGKLGGQRSAAEQAKTLSLAKLCRS